jgi:hypothetical protein
MPNLGQKINTHLPGHSVWFGFFMMRVEEPAVISLEILIILRQGGLLGLL